MGEWVSNKKDLPALGKTTLCRVKHWNSHLPMEVYLIRVAEGDCDWRTADDNSEIDYNWTVIEWYLDE